MAPPRATAWPHSIYHDTDVLTLDEHGQFILCRVCAEHYAAHGGKKPKRVRMNARFRTRAWETHKRRTRAHNPADMPTAAAAGYSVDSESDELTTLARRLLSPSAAELSPIGAMPRSQEARPQIERTQFFIYPGNGPRTSVESAPKHDAHSRSAHDQEWLTLSATMHGSDERFASATSLQTAVLDHSSRRSAAESREHKPIPEGAPLSIKSLLNPAPIWDDSDSDPYE